MSIARRRTLLFGDYLLGKGLISRGDIDKALQLQKEHNRETEQVVRRTGLLSDEQIEDIRGFREGHLYFGEALVKLGVMAGDAMLERLEEFRTKQPRTDVAGE
jgi:hypothetical protein